MLGWADVVTLVIDYDNTSFALTDYWTGVMYTSLTGYCS